MSNIIFAKPAHRNGWAPESFPLYVWPCYITRDYILLNLVNYSAKLQQLFTLWV